MYHHDSFILSKKDYLINLLLYTFLVVLSRQKNWQTSWLRIICSDLDRNTIDKHL